ncbi:MAG TPA: hypothetical protein PKA06_11315, partial [Gemmatales bacterium]|nr:hypothetical protein [Gemmatales bacterium]
CVITDWKQLWKIHLAVILCLCYIAYEINDIYLSQGYLLVYKRGYGGLDNNGAALMLAMGVPMCLYAWDGIRKWWRWGFLLAVPVIIHAVLTSYSRGAMVSLIAIIPIFLFRAQRRVQVLVMLGAILALVPIMATSISMLFAVGANSMKVPTPGVPAGPLVGVWRWKILSLVSAFATRISTPLPTVPIWKAELFTLNGFKPPPTAA